MRPVSVGEGIPPGPHAGRIWRDVPAVTRDPFSGREITRLTHYRGHSHHLPGAVPCWLDGGRRLVLVSDREGHGNLFAYDFTDSTLTQLTDLRTGDHPERVSLTGESQLAFWYGRLCYELELVSLRIRPAHRAPRAAPAASPGFTGEMPASHRRRLLWLAAPGAPASQRRALALLPASVRSPARPCLSPDGSRVVFVADDAGYAQIFSVDAQAPASLPLVSSLPAALRPAPIPAVSARGASAPRSTRPRA